MKFIKKFEEIRLADIASVGGKNASLGEMIQELGKQRIEVPSGFAITAAAYWYFIEHNNLLEALRNKLAPLSVATDLVQLKKTGAEIRALFEQGKIPADLVDEITLSYEQLCKKYSQKECAVAVRSSATAEDLPGASFAGQQETYLNVQGAQELLASYKKGLASLFTDRALMYRMEKGFDHMRVALSVGVQKMIRSDLACSGVIFTVDTETGFKDLVLINASYGLGEAIVQGSVNPDEFCVYKTTLLKGFLPIVKRQLGQKKIKVVYADHGIRTEAVSAERQKRFCLQDEEIISLARMAIAIENYYSTLHKTWTPMDIEWAKDGQDGKLYIIQARPETVQVSKKQNLFVHYSLKNGAEHTSIVTGESIGQKIASGNARVVKNMQELSSFQAGDVLVTDMTDPDWVPIMKKAAAIVTNRGGRTCHAAIVSRELGIPAIVGTQEATTKITPGEEITVDCSTSKVGVVYKGKIPFEQHETNIETLPHAPVDILLNIADPDQAYTLSFLPVQGVGLARTEFIVGTSIKMHPMVAIMPEKVTDKSVMAEIYQQAAGYPDLKTFFVDVLAQGVGTIAAAFYPRPVIVRFSDFKSNEYRNLLGGSFFEPIEQNPMLGLRGASRYYSKLYAPAFKLECAAMKKVREVMGFTNVKLMVPFVRTVTEAEKVVEIINECGLVAGKNALELLMMCEIPSNVILLNKFAHYFDGFSIGSNDLTQTTLAVDRDSGLLSDIFDERDPAVKDMMTLAIERARSAKKHIGICGQAPSDYPELADFLISQKINSISLNADSVIPFLLRYA